MHVVWIVKDDIEAAYRPHHTCNAADRDRDGPRSLKWGGKERITQTERGTCWWKLILKGWYRLWGAKKDVHVYEMNIHLVNEDIL